MKISYILILLFSISVIGCTSITFKNPSNALIHEEPTNEVWTNHFLGAFGKEQIEASCPDGKLPVQTRTRLTVATGTVSILTLGIYTPLVAEYWCEE